MIGVVWNKIGGIAAEYEHRAVRRKTNWPNGIAVRLSCRDKRDMTCDKVFHIYVLLLEIPGGEVQGCIEGKLRSIRRKHERCCRAKENRCSSVGSLSPAFGNRHTSRDGG